MADFLRINRYLKKRRKKKSSSRRLALKQSGALLPVSEINSKKNPVDRMHVELVVKTCNKNTESLSSSPRGGRFWTTVGKVMQQCRHKFNQIWTGFCSVLFFWRVYTQRVELLYQKVEALQKELQLLHNNSLLPQEPRCSGCHGTTAMSHHQHNSIAPPPPPPPPPPLPPPPPPIQVPQRLSLVPKSKTSHSSLKEKVDPHFAVTLKDLQAVQLRKVTATKKRLISPDGKRAPLVTVADLQKVCLRRVQCNVLSTKRSPGRSPSKSTMKLRLPQRKVQNDRTTSDVPLCNKENIEKNSCIIINRVLENNC